MDDQKFSILRGIIGEELWLCGQINDSEWYKASELKWSCIVENGGINHIVVTLLSQHIVLRKYLNIPDRPFEKSVYKLADPESIGKLREDVYEIMRAQFPRRKPV